MIILALSVPKTSESYDEVAAGHKTRRYVGSLDLRIRKDMPLHTMQWNLTKRYIDSIIRLPGALGREPVEDGIRHLRDCGLPL
jgi:hypothetical protein